MIRRPLTALMALTILASSFSGLTGVARAQDAAPTNPPAGFIDPADQFKPTINCTGNNCDVTPSAAAQTDTAAQNKPTSPASPAATPPEDVYGSVMVQIMGLFAMLLGIAVVTLDNAVYYTVVDMGKYLKNLSAVGVSWRILRDIGNVILIFGFLVIGISVILDLNIYGYGTKMLPTLLIAAVFLNFSLFISEAVIDAGNLFATQFYTQINGGDPPAPVSYANAQGVGISNRIMGQLGLSGIYGDALNNDPQHHLLGNGTPWYVGFLGILLFLVAAFVIFSLAFILIARFVILVFLIIVAPIGFAGLAVPKLEKSAREWWGQLFEQTITAPILLLMLYVALAVITDANFLTGLAAPGQKAEWTGFLSGNVDGFAALMLSFLVAMGLLLAVTILAKRLGAFGGAWATNLGSKLSVGMTSSALAFGGRRTLGTGSQAMSKYLRRTSFGQKNILGRAAVNLFDKGAKSSFDYRKTETGKGLQGALRRYDTGLELGKPSDTSARKREEESIKARQDYAKSLKQTKAQQAQQKALEDRVRRENESHEASRKATEESYRPERERLDQEVKDQRKKVNAARAAFDASKSAADKDALDREEKALANRFAELNKVREEQRDFTQKLDEAHKAALGVIQEQIKNAKEAPQREYVEALRRNPLGSYLAYGPGVEDAAKKILQDAGKSKQERDIESFLKSVEDATKKASSGGGGSAPAAPKPSAP